MIKQGIQFVLFICCMITTACSAQKNIVTEQVNTTTTKQPVEDAVLKKLQGENDLLVAYAIENFAWVRSIDYRILAQQGNEWKAYVYHKNLMPNNAGKPTSFSESTVDKAKADALLKYLADNKAWAIKGDGENAYCADGNKNCTIADASGARLWLITKTSATAPGYYAPEFYQECCPDAQRGLFLSIIQKITGLVADEGVTE